VHLLGRVTVPVRGHLNLPKKWVKDATLKVEGKLTKETLMESLETKLIELVNESYEGPERTTTLEIYEPLLIISRTEFSQNRQSLVTPGNRDYSY